MLWLLITSDYRGTHIKAEAIIIVPFPIVARPFSLGKVTNGEFKSQHSPAPFIFLFFPFGESDIKDYNIKKYPHLQGKSVLIPRQRYRLKRREEALDLSHRLIFSTETSYDNRNQIPIQNKKYDQALGKGDNLNSRGTTLLVSNAQFSTTKSQNIQRNRKE